MEKRKVSLPRCARARSRRWDRYSPSQPYEPYSFSIYEIDDFLKAFFTNTMLQCSHIISNSHRGKDEWNVR